MSVYARDNKGNVLGDGCTEGKRDSPKTHVHEDLIHQPNVIVPPQPPEPETQQRAHDTKRPGEPQEANVGNRVGNRVGDLVAVVAICVLESLGFLERGEGAWDDEEPGKDDPCPQAG